MFHGDLATTPLPAVLRALAAEEATGCIRLTGPSGDSARIFLKAGRVYGVQAPGLRPSLGTRLVATATLAPARLEEALEVQRTELQGWRLGELLVHLGLVDRPVVEAFVLEQVQDGLCDVARWPHGAWRFRKSERTRDDVVAPQPVEPLLEVVEERLAQWATLTRTIRGPGAVPTLAASGPPDGEVSLGREAYTLLCQVDGQRDLADLARACGYTLYEAGQVVDGLVRAGLLEVEPESDAEEPLDDDGEADDDQFSASIARVSQALSSLLGPRAGADDDAYAVPDLPRSEARQGTPLVAEEDEDARRRAATREAAAAELAAAHATALDVRDTLAPGSLLVPPLQPEGPEAQPEAVPVDDVQSDDLAEAGDAPVVEVAHVEVPAVEVPAVEALDVEAESEVESEVDIEVATPDESAVAVELEPALPEPESVEALAELAELAESAEPEEDVADQVDADEAARVQADEAARQAEESARREAEEAAARKEARRVESERLAQEDVARVEAERLAAEEAERRIAAEVEAELSAAAREPLSPAHAPRGEDARAGLALLSQLTQEEPPPAPAEATEPAPAPLPVPQAPRLGGPDKASLLRELASLGLEDDDRAPAPPPLPRPAPRPAPRPMAVPPAKKRRGFFGKG